MASLTVSPLPHKLGITTSRRIPLGDIPNAANSPARTYAALKRSRDQVEAQENFSHDVQPQAKRRFFDNNGSIGCLSPTKPGIRSKDDPDFTKRPSNPQLTAFERRCLATREDKAQQKVERFEKPPQETLEGIRQWQKHYKKAFPQFVFYFEGVPEDVRQKCSKWVRTLGAREEKFFSRDVTHVVTNRSPPNAADNKDAIGFTKPPVISRSSHMARTINPSLLDRQAESHGSTQRVREIFGLEASTIRRPTINGHRDVELQKLGVGNVDILLKAQEMGMKVWQLEKLQRVMNTMHESSNDPHTHPAQHARAKGNSASVRAEKEADLSRMLRNERLHGPSDRDASVNLTEIVPFKGPYIYIRDIDERTKPILVKEFAKPTRKGDLGEWPQFRAVSHGKCPFVEEISKEDMMKVKLRQEEALAQKQTVETRSITRSRAAAREAVYDNQSVDENEADLAQTEDAQHPSQEISNVVNVYAPKSGKTDVPQFCPPPSRLPRSPSKAQVTMSTKAGPKIFGGEPAASGLQPSTITSAIRSQMISSTAAGPGVKAGTSKEVHGLKRKVLEKNAGPVLSTIQTRQQCLNLNNNARAEQSISFAPQHRRRIQKTLQHIDEESTQSEEDEDVAEDARTIRRGLVKVEKEKVPKPGYCENCREKYEDFDEHIVGRRHRKFALAPENWRDLDRLLAHLGRPLKQYESDGF